ncbi:MAG: Asp-tRNA(Asn)/Glu-tRNA(Gln) amidotransferase subunit GatB [Candidatus Pacebacteria bacterium]|nr:Asp-tRNA(Asn)/Glu-tRNA(Gln) amidotransferase subunit GatB [Candidatus Paceibacterota bacterium]
MKYQPKIGLEVHIELKTRSKMFCSCINNSLEKRPNVNICSICLGHPGVLPTINEKAIKLVIKTALALNCKIAKVSKFERKNYFYPDLPKGYQISQYKEPIATEGFLILPSSGKKIRIRRIHLEEDTAKLIYPEGKNYSLLDFNRAGIPLMELVTEPDIESAKEAKEFAKELQLILRYLDVSDADMEKGQMRIEANVSITQISGVNSQNLGTKVEIKNLNSFRAVEKAVEYEIKRQAEILESRGEVVQETRGWNEKKGITLPQREKEEAHDYRYFPEPDLPSLELSDEFIKEIKLTLPEMPSQKRVRFLEEFQLSEKVIETLINNKNLNEYFEKVVSELLRWMKDKGIEENKKAELIKTLANFLLTEALGLLKGKTFREKNFPITPENFAEFITIIKEKNLTSKMAKILLEEMFKTKKDPSDILQEKELRRVDDEIQITEIAQKIIKMHPQAIRDFQSGKREAIQFLIGQMMRETKGKVNPQKAKEILTKLLTNN